MLTITVDPQNPLQALEDCTALVRMLAEVFTLPREVELSERAQGAAAMIFNAIEDGQDAIAETLGEVLRDREGRMKPAWRQRLGERAAVPVPGVDTPMTFQDEAGKLHRILPLPSVSLPDDAGAGMIRTAAPASPASPPAAPLLTEPRHAAQSRRAA